MNIFSLRLRKALEIEGAHDKKPSPFWAMALLLYDQLESVNNAMISVFSLAALSPSIRFSSINAKAT